MLLALTLDSCPKGYSICCFFSAEIAENKESFQDLMASIG